MRRHLASALLLSLTLCMSATAAAQDAGGDAMLAEINATRAAQQLPPLTRSADLDAIAAAHSQDMAQNGALAHVSDTTGSPEDRVRAAGLSTSSVAENVALHRDAGQAQQALLASPPHLGNMMSTNSTHVGIGIVQVPQGVYVTQVFAALPASAPAVPAVEATPAPLEAGPVFGIIPPFVENAVENAVEQAEGVAAPVLEAPAVDTLPTPAVLDPFGAGAPTPAVEAPVLADTPAAPVEAADAPATPQTIDVSPEAASSLRQLFDMGLSLLGRS